MIESSADAECAPGMEKCANDNRFCVYSSQDCPLNQLQGPLHEDQDASIDKSKPHKWYSPLIELRVVEESVCNRSLTTCSLDDDGHPWIVIATADDLDGEHLLVGKTAPEFISGDKDVKESDNFSSLIKKAGLLQNKTFQTSLVEEVAKEDQSRSTLFLIV